MTGSRPSFACALLRTLALLLTLQGSAPVWAQSTSLPQSVLEYNAEGQLTKNQDPLGHATTQSYDAAGRLTQQTPPAPSVAASGVPDTTQYRYDGLGHLTQRTDARGKVAQYTWDNVGRLSKVQYFASATATTAEETHTYSWLASGRRMQPNNSVERMPAPWARCDRVPAATAFLS